VERIHAVCQAIRRLPVPVVARLHGAVIGAGLEIAAACDLRIAAEGTKFAMPEVRLGIPSHGWCLPARRSMRSALANAAAVGGSAAGDVDSAKHRALRAREALKLAL
jgi:enoyl-CoA hydratase/carnithine racemase